MNSDCSPNVRGQARIIRPSKVNPLKARHSLVGAIFVFLFTVHVSPVDAGSDPALPYVVSAAMRVAEGMRGNTEQPSNKLMPIGNRKHLKMSSKVSDDVARILMPSPEGDDDDIDDAKNHRLVHFHKWGWAKLDFTFVWNDDYVIVAFAGTDGAKDEDGNPTKDNNEFVNGLGDAGNLKWCTPSNVMPDFASVIVHPGWADAARSCYPAIKRLMEQGGNVSKPLTLVGHSMGGAVAGHMYYLLRYKDQGSNCPPHIDLITFGAPRYATPQMQLALADRKPDTTFNPMAYEVNGDSVPGTWSAYLQGTVGVNALAGPSLPVLPPLERYSSLSLEQISSTIPEVEFGPDTSKHVLDVYLKWYAGR